MNHVWQFLRRAGHVIGRGLSISLIKACQFTHWSGRGVGHGLLISLIKIWQFTSWAGRGIGRGLSISLTRSWQFTYWVVPRICRGTWFVLSTTWFIFWWTVREFLILLFKMVYGPKRALTIFAALVVVLHLWEHLWGGVRNPNLIFLTEYPTFAILTVAGIFASLVDLILFYEWGKSRLSPKANLPVPVEPEQDRQYELPKPIFHFPSKRVYSDLEKARALVVLSKGQSVPSVSQQLDIPKSTLYSWKSNYQKDARFRFLIDQLIWLVTRAKMSRNDRQDQIEMKRPY